MVQRLKRSFATHKHKTDGHPGTFTIKIMTEELTQEHSYNNYNYHPDSQEHSCNIFLGEIEVGREIPKFLMPEDVRLSAATAKKAAVTMMTKSKVRIKNIHVAAEIPVEYLEHRRAILQQVVANLKLQAGVMDR